ncbi:MAG: hypothetical protein KF819_36995 [Labilithrix sp.]|nr:hypothetical protein [Labilithrix sp.]
MKRAGLLAIAGALVFACDRSEEAVAPAESDVVAGCEPSDGAPSDLRCTGLYADFASKTLSPRARPFAPAVAFWSDGADKQRFIDLPDGAPIDTTSMDEWRFPVGTKVWKEFRVSGTLVETRFFHKVRDDRWVHAAYVWSPDGSSATKSDGVDVDVGGVKYHVPKSSECSDCHKGKKDKLLGFEAISLGQPGASGLTLAALAAEGRLSAPPATTSVAIADDGTKRAPALAWLHVNCGTSCHTGTTLGTAYGTGLRLKIGFEEIATKPPATWDIVTSTVGVAVKSPKWSGETRIVAGDASSSLLLRLLAQRGGEQMPPIATKLVDDAGKSAVEVWIAAMTPAAVELPPPEPPAEPPADPPPEPPGDDS